MSKPVFIIQRQAQVNQVEQALDSTLVAAIFDTGPCLLSFVNQTEFAQLLSKEILQEKLAQLSKLQTEIMFADEMQVETLQALLASAECVFSF